MNMRDNRKKQRNKGYYLYLPVWLIVSVCIVCAIAGIFIGHSLNKPNDIAENKESTSSVDPSQSVTQNTTHSKVDRTQWNLILVNKNNALPDDYNPKVKYLQNGHAIDERAYQDLQDMMDDCREAGLDPLICSSYRTMEKQKELFNNKVNQYLNQGYSQDKAEQAAGELVAIPGTSEHQLALALDIVDVSYQILDEKQEDSPVQKWLLKNSWKYGFILRYPSDKSEITGISYEPWHYRYVGKNSAKEIYESGLCLEEYLEQ